MAISVAKRPLGHVLDTTAVTACIYDDYGSAVVYKTSHGLTTGQYVYIKSNVSTYNGFWYVQVLNGSYFYLREYATASNLAGIVDTCDVEYYVSVLDHGYQCVHLPIVYKLYSTLWPTNTVDTSRTISSITNDNGLCNLNLSGSLGTFDELEYVKISSNTDFADEVYQIIDKVSTSDITINRAYEAGLSTSGTIILYYNNYTVYVNIYGGLNADHYWQSEKPYTLLTTLKVTPDANNIATINIAEILKTQISPTENSTLSPYLPSNLDFFTQFYIEVAESYDDAVSGEVVETISSYTSDVTNFEGSAVNAQLPFKNIHSGHLSEYIYADENNLIQFLNLFDPVLFSGEYFDLSWISNLDSTDNSGISYRIKLEYYLDGSLQLTNTDNFNSVSECVYRKEVPELSGYDQIDYTIQSNLTVDPDLQDNNFTISVGSEILRISFINGYLYTSSAISGGAPGFTYNTDRCYFSYSFLTGESRNFKSFFNMTLFLTGVSGSITVNFILQFVFYNNALSVIDTVTAYTITRSSNGTTSTGNINAVASYTATSDISYVGIRFRTVYSGGGSFSGNATANFLSFTELSQFVDISETQTIEISDACSNNEIYLGWLNYLGGFEYWKFTARKDYVYDIEDSQISKKNIYTNWPQSYGEFANSVTKQIARNSRKQLVVRSQHLTLAQLEGIKYIKLSPLVQIIEDKYNVTNVVVDSGSFRTHTDQDDTYMIEFTISFTDQIPAQFE